jgi:hypothetical protein
MRTRACEIVRGQFHTHTHTTHTHKQPQKSKEQQTKNTREHLNCSKHDLSSQASCTHSKTCEKLSVRNGGLETVDVLENSCTKGDRCSTPLRGWVCCMCVVFAHMPGLCSCTPPLLPLDACSCAALVSLDFLSISTAPGIDKIICLTNGGRVTCFDPVPKSWVRHINCSKQHLLPNNLHTYMLEDS